MKEGKNMTVTKTNGKAAIETRIFNEDEKEVRNNTALLPMDGKEREEDEDEITLEDLAPDGGWGWMVAIAMILIFITTFGPTSSFGIIFGDLLEETGQAGTAMTLFNSVFMVSFSIAGLMTNTLLKRYSMRPVGVVGAMLFSFPNVCLAFVRNVYEMAFINFLQGLGLGLIFTICNTNFNAYFVKKRAPVMSAAQVIIGLGGIAYPICIDKMMKMYGFRGTALMTGAMSLNSIVGMTMMHPVEWHARKPEDVRAEKRRAKEEWKLRGVIPASDRRYSDFITAPVKTRCSSLTSLKDESGKQVPLLIETLKTPAKRVASISEIEDRIYNRMKSKSMRELLTQRLSAFSSSSLMNLVTGIGSLGDTRQYHSDGTKVRKIEKGVQVSMEEKKDIGKRSLQLLNVQ